MNAALPNLDLLRAIAVLCVVGSHWAFLLHWDEFLIFLFGGADPAHTGVMLFFVHTSLVLMFSLERLAESGPARRVIPAFYLRRMFRLYPLSVFTIVIMLLFRIPSFFTNTFWMPDQLTLWTNLSLTQNLFHQRSILAPLWSLPLELQMYLVLPFLFYGVRRSGPRGLQFALLCWVSASAFEMANLDVYWQLLGELLYVPCFLGGVVAYANYRRGRGRWPFWGWPLCIMISCYTVPPHSPLFAYFTCLFLGMVVSRFRECPNQLFNKLTVKVATYSYSLYLLHVPVLHYIYEVHPELPGPVKFVASLLALAAVCWLAYHGVERPGIKLGLRLTRGWVGSEGAARTPPP
ncbi:acyltransferase [bacterium]|nr:acyltransferase [bacterium]